MAWRKNIRDFTIGADPEFLCVNTNGSIITASESCDDPESGEFGADGSGITFEVRPRPSTNPLEVVSNIHKIFTAQILENSDFAKYKWLAGSYNYDYSLGGHIHFGIKENIITGEHASAILSQYLGSLSVLIEKKEEGKKRRARHDYGGMIDFRRQNHGFEYRTPSSWLTSPYIAGAMMTLAKTIMFETLNNSSFSPSGYFESSDFKEMKTEKIKESFPEIWKEITEMRLYKYFKPHIDIIHYLISNNLSWYPNADFKEVWGLVDYTMEGSPINLETIWHRFNEKSLQ